MGKYIIKYTDTAIRDLKRHKKVGNKATLNKIIKLLKELENHPYTGTGQPEELKYELRGFGPAESIKKIDWFMKWQSML